MLGELLVLAALDFPEGVHAHEARLDVRSIRVTTVRTPSVRWGAARIEPKPRVHGDGATVIVGRLRGDPACGQWRRVGRGANAYQASGRTADAIAILEPLLADRRRLLGAEHPKTLNTANSLADAYRAAGRTADAERLLEPGS